MTRAPRPSPRPTTGAVTIALAALVATGSWSPASAVETPRLVPFQGRLADGDGTPLSGLNDLAFAIYDEATGGTALWSEVHTKVPVIAGQVNVLLGSLTSLDDPDANGNADDAIRFDGTAKPKFLGIKIGGDSAQELVPRHQLVPSFHARLADTTVENGVGTRQLKDGAVTTKKIDPEALIPAGSILPYGGTTAPPGWVLCDGTEYDGNDPTYLALFQAIGTSFGAGSGGTHFNVPDLRGQFLRGRDAGAGVDPDAAARTGGDAVGSTQGSAIVGLSGTVAPSSTATSTDGEHDHRVAAFNIRGNQDGPIPSNGLQLSFLNANAHFTSSAGAHAHTVNIPASPVNISPTSGTTSTEVRPKNVAVNYICKL